MSSERRDWPHDLASLQELAINEILPRWRDDVNRPDRAYPTIEWLEDNGYSHLRWVLKTKHDMTVGMFFSMVVGRGYYDGYDWNVNDPRTIKTAEEYLNEKLEDRDWATTTEKQMRARLNTTFGVIADALGHDNIIDALDDPNARQDTYEAVKTAIRRIRRQAKSDPSAEKYLRAIMRFVAYLDRGYVVDENVISDLDEEFRFSSPDDGAETFSPKQISKLWEAASAPTEYAFVIGYTIWGLRTKELPTIHQSQFIFDGEDLKIDFDEGQRKNGAGTVTILFGTDYIIDLLERNDHKSAWNGHLIPDPEDPSEPMDPEKARERFKKLCRRAGVEIDGELPTPRNGRATYYDMQSKAEAMHLELLSERVEPQGAVDPESAFRYPDEETKQLMIRLLYYLELKPVLPDGAVESDYVFLRTLESLDDEIDIDPLYDLYDNLK